jgi:hypothetical protein
MLTSLASLATSLAFLLIYSRASFSDPIDQQYFFSERPSRLPAIYRYADSSVCRYGQWELSSNATLTELRPKVPVHPHQKSFVNGGYENIAKGSGEIHKAGAFLATLSMLQHTDLQIFGSVCEMGVHHGRFTGFLYLTARQNEKLIAADLFLEHQDQNVDKSGMGDYDQFARGMQLYGMDATKDLHTVFKGSSDEIPFDWSFQKNFEPFRLVSVDAGHTAALTFNDLQLAFCNLQRGGIVILDDWFHPMWPGVVEGYHQFVALGPNVPQLIGQVYPFLLCESKLYVTNDRNSHARYYDRILNDEELSQWVTPFAHEKERGSLLYEMNEVNYLRCRSSAASIDVEHIRAVWRSRLY